jgi:hypothetical protein
MDAFCPRSLSIIVVLVVSLATVRAELPPDAYRSMQGKAPEALRVTIEKVVVSKAKEMKATVSKISAQARVDEVKRTATKLKPGDVIQISYQQRRHSVPMAGPSEPDIVEKGRTYPAFLRKGDGGKYNVAAGGYSFRKLD